MTAATVDIGRSIGYDTRLPAKAMTALNQTIVQAINDRRRQRFVYNGREHTVEPQCYGIGTRGTELLRAYQLEGGSQGVRSALRAQCGQRRGGRLLLVLAPRWPGRLHERREARGQLV